MLPAVYRGQTLEDWAINGRPKLTMRLTASRLHGRTLTGVHEVVAWCIMYRTSYPRIGLAANTDHVTPTDHSKDI